MLLDDLLQWYCPMVLNYATVIRTSFHLVFLDQTEVDQVITHQPGEEHKGRVGCFLQIYNPVGREGKGNPRKSLYI